MTDVKVRKRIESALMRAHLQQNLNLLSQLALPRISTALRGCNNQGCQSEPWSIPENKADQDNW
jgi:hypothetical protein